MRMLSYLLDNHEVIRTHFAWPRVPDEVGTVCMTALIHAAYPER